MNMFELPTVGSAGNWGAALNRNFDKIELLFNRMQNTINSLHSIIGGQTPYVKMDEGKYFIGFKRKDDQLLIYYYSKTPENANKTEPAEDDQATITYNITNKWSSPPTIDLGSYVLFADESVSSLLPGGESFKRGDFAVVVEEFGSIYGDNYISSIYKKYPTLGEYYLPQPNYDEPYKLHFVKTNYVDWFAGNEEFNYALPSIGLGAFNYFTYSNGKYGLNSDLIDLIYSSTRGIKFSFVCPEGTVADSYSVLTEWFLGNTPVFLSYNITKETTATATTAGNFIATIKFDTSGLSSSEILRCNVYVLNKGSTVYTGQVIES